MSEIKDCVLCGEHAFTVELNDNYLVRADRRSRCRFYKKFKMHTCQTEVYDDRGEAIKEWNYRQKVYSDVIGRKS